MIHLPVKKIICYGESIYDAIFEARRIISNKFSRYIDENLCGACGMASLFLRNKIMDNGDRAFFVMGDYDWDGVDCTHCWIEWNNRIVDITKTQFNYFDKVFIGWKKFHPEYKKDFNLKNSISSLNTWGDANPFLYECIWHSDKKAEIVLKD